MKIFVRNKKEHLYAVVKYSENGKRKEKWIPLHLRSNASKDEIKQMLSNIECSFEEMFPPEDGTILFTRYISQWVEKKKGTVAQSTWEGYSIYAGAHIIPYFEKLNLHLQDLTPAHISEYYNYKYNGGRKDGKEGGLSIESIIKHKSLLIKALNDAVIDELIPMNPARYVKLPAKRSSKREENFLNTEEAIKMLEIFKGTQYYSIVLTTLSYGLRKSEALGLKWSSVDFIKDTLTLENTVVKNLTVVEKPTMKTSASYHTYPLLPNVKRVLLEQKAWQRANKERLGDAYNDSDYVFTWDDGRTFRPDDITRSFQRILRRNKFPIPLRFHDLRHSTASILYERNWDLKDIQLWLRHADIKETANTYTHIKQKNVDQIPEYLQQVFSPQPKKEGKILTFEK